MSDDNADEAMASMQVIVTRGMRGEPGSFKATIHGEELSVFRHDPGRIAVAVNADPDDPEKPDGVYFVMTEHMARGLVESLMDVLDGPAPDA